MTELVRGNPDIGYLDAATARELGLSQIVRAGEWLHLSGVAPVSTASGSLELLSPGDYRAQLSAVLDVISRTLQAERASLADVVSMTIYARDVADYVPNVDVVRTAFGDDNLPASTLVGVSALFFEEQRVEVVVAAYRGSRWCSSRPSAYWPSSIRARS